MVLCANFQALEGEQAQLYKKIATLVLILDEVIASGQQPSFFNDVAQLQLAVEKQIKWKNMKIAGTAAACMFAWDAGLIIYDHIKHNS